jgi:hypothetical protein
MATKVFKVEQLELDNGTTITVKPLKIKVLRKFMDEISKLGKVEEEDDGLDIIVAAANIAIKACNPDLDDAFDAEEELELPTLYRVLELAGGIDLTGGSNLTSKA